MTIIRHSCKAVPLIVVLAQPCPKTDPHLRSCHLIIVATMGLVVNKVVDGIYKFAPSELNLTTRKCWLEDRLHLLVVR
jgi:hypothetical protein